jgi:hypothetical protein
VSEGPKKLKLSNRDLDLYEALVSADDALYRLWRLLPLDANSFVSTLHTLQKSYIQPAIAGLRAKGLQCQG